VPSQFCVGVRGGQVRIGEPLELQACNGSPAQRFAVDGDSILMGTQADGRVTRELAIEPDRRRTPNHTPLVVAERDVSDAQYLRYEATDHSARKPTNGLLEISNEAALDWTLLVFGWGTVIEVQDQAPLLLSKTPKVIREGVTLRGYRKYTYQGPEIRTCLAPKGGHALGLAEPQARVTGLRLRGPTSDTQCRGELGDDSTAIRVDTGSFADNATAWVDHVDIGYWHGHAIDVHGGSNDNCRCSPVELPRPRHTVFRAVANFIHHNTNYGIVTGTGAFVRDEGNVFYRQGAHSIASDPVDLSGYEAYDNLVLQNDNLDKPTHDIDMHGGWNLGDQIGYTSDGKPAVVHFGHWQGGIAGDYFDVGSNTVIPDGHTNLDLRGTPCRKSIVQYNVFTRSKSEAIENHSTVALDFHGNKFGAANPMTDLAIGDFDGDGIDDVFVGTGAAWYFSSGGQAGWRFMNRMPEHASALRFGDFDGDGRTDVLARHGENVDGSWGGLSPWQTINVTHSPIDDIGVGDFDGDRVADLFLATGTQWFYAPGGKNWTPFATSHVHTRDLRLGDFTHEGHTEVLRISASHEWQLVRHVGATWESLGSSRDAVLSELVVGDFDGDGFADVARLHTDRWEMTSPARGPGWVHLLSTGKQILGRPLGRFDANGTSDVIVWNGPQFYHSRGAKDPPVKLSRQDMN
jgi:hypothetical protein